MRSVANWLSLLLIAIIVFSPIFEAFDETDGPVQDVSDWGRYAICLFCLLALALRHTVIPLCLASFRQGLVGSIFRPAIERCFSGVIPVGMKDRGLFLTLRDLRI